MSGAHPSFRDVNWYGSPKSFSSLGATATGGPIIWVIGMLACRRFNLDTAYLPSKLMLLDSSTAYIHTGLACNLKVQKKFVLNYNVPCRDDAILASLKCLLMTTTATTDWLLHIYVCSTRFSQIYMMHA